MNNSEHTEVQHKIHLVILIVQDLDLEGFIDAGNAVDALGPILNPTAYRDSMHDGQRVKFLSEQLAAKKLLELKKLVKERIEIERADSVQRARRKSPAS
jgi:hypothetical protein